VRLIEAGLKPEDSFLDIGTGSGILMVVAGKLGTGRLCGVDRDELAVRIASENLHRNRIAADRFHLVQGSLAAPVQGRFDVVVANILTHVVLELLDDVPRVLKPGGIFICSGIIEENKNLVVGRMTVMDFEVMDVRLQEGWVAIAGRAPAPAAHSS
jgi:ribosomal protein L11 methyltransferase